ncbi:MAG: stage III sporulation AC/AD family protein [Christensenellales bacterium]
MVVKIIGIALIGTILCIITKSVKPDFVVFIVIATSVLILISIFDEFALLINTGKTYLAILDYGGINILQTIFKVLGVSYVIEFASDIAEESGFSSIANKVVFAGKIIVATMCLPYVLNLFEMVLNLI